MYFPLGTIKSKDYHNNPQYLLNIFHSFLCFHYYAFFIHDILCCVLLVIATTIMGETREEIVAMIKGFPGGVPGRKVAEQYNRTYHKNLTVASLGFKSMALLLASLDKELVVQGELVFHRSWPPGVADTALEAGDGDQSTAQEAGERPSVSALGDGQPAKARKKRLRSGRGASPAPPAGQPLEVSSSSGGVPSFCVYQAPLGKHSVPAGAGKPVQTLSQDQLLQRITQVGCVTQTVKLECFWFMIWFIYM